MRPTIEEEALAKHTVLSAHREDATCEIEELLLPGIEIPVVPGDVVVLAVGVVVAPLCAPDLVSPQEHRDSRGEHESGNHVANLALADLDDGRVLCLTLDPVVGRPVVVGAVAIVFEVGLIVLVVVRGEVAHGEAVMRGDEVDGGVGAPALTGVEIGRPRKAPAKFAHARSTTPEVAEVVAVTAIPLRPEGRELTDLIATRTDIPRLGDQLDAAQGWVLLDRRHEGAEHVDVVEGPRQCRCEIEAEAIDMHLGHPVAQ